MTSKTGFERKGFDNIHVCMVGAFLTADHRNKLEYGNASYCRPVESKQVEICKDWLRKCAKKQDLVNLSHTSYGLKHVVEYYTMENQHTIDSMTM
jgi:hypothetical protein